MKSKIRLSAVALITLAIVFFIFLRTSHFKNGYSDTDPDRYYHFAVSRLMVEKGHILRELPQVHGLGWDKYFPDKEFLFHVGTAIAYKLGKESAVLWLIKILGLAILFMIMLTMRRFVSWKDSFLLILITIFSNTYFISRILLTRPHLLAILAILIFVYGLISNKKWVAFAGTLMFGLSYHAFYVPLMILAVYIFVFFKERHSVHKVIGFSLTGCVIGNIVNPYFPSNILMGIKHMNIAVNMDEMKNLGFGVELIPTSTDIFLQLHGFLIMLIFIGIFFLLNKKERTISEGDQRIINYFLILAVLFWGLSLKSPRAAEYAVPFTAFFVAASLIQFKKWKNLAIALLFIGVVGGEFNQLKPFYSEVRTKNEDVTKLLESVDHFPKKTGGLVFNCEWSYAPYIFYKRPDLSFLDILDPTFYRDYNPEAKEFRTKLGAGLVADPYLLIRQSIGADYVACAHDGVVQQLEADPRFKRIYPAKPFGSAETSGRIFIFEVAKENPKNFITNLQISSPVFVDLKDIQNVELKDFSNNRSTLLQPDGTTTSPYFDLLKWSSSQKIEIKVDSNKAVCYLVEPVNLKSTGSDLFAFGGGPMIKVWSRGRLLYHSISPIRTLRTIEAFLPIKDMSSLQVVACASTKSNELGVSLSQWKHEEVNEMCAVRNNLDLKQKELFSKTPLLTDLDVNCFGMVARVNTASTKAHSP